MGWRKVTKIRSAWAYILRGLQVLLVNGKHQGTIHGDVVQDLQGYACLQKELSNNQRNGKR